jgi:hypothetical protein
MSKKVHKEGGGGRRNDANWSQLIKAFGNVGVVVKNNKNKNIRLLFQDWNDPSSLFFEPGHDQDVELLNKIDDAIEEKCDDIYFGDLKLNDQKYAEKILEGVITAFSHTTERSESDGGWGH